MTNKEFGKKLENRTKIFAYDIIKLSASIPYSEESKVVKYQVTKSGTSIGANYREANRSRSKADFYHKIKISEGEASETVYWLELAEMAFLHGSNEVKRLLIESNELLAIFTTISSKMKKKK